MGVTVYSDDKRYIPIRSGQPCPVCGSKKGRCSEYWSGDKLVLIRCKYSESDKPSNGWYLHMMTSNVVAETRQPLTVVSETPITEDILDLRDRVYRKYRQLVKKYLGDYLEQTDRDDLKNRGLTDEQIESMGFFSIPTTDRKVWVEEKYQAKVLTAICKELETEFGKSLLQVAGFMVRRSKSRREEQYITIQTMKTCHKQSALVLVRGYYIPYHDLKGRLVGLQYRLMTPVYDEDGDPLRYFWFSSTQARSGAPIDFYTPREVKRMDIILLTEGALKGKIAAERLKYRTISEPGINNYRRMVEMLQELEKIENCKFKVLTALDMDKEKIEVQRAETATLSLLKGTGYEVAQMTWDSSCKGIDDATQSKVKIQYTLI